MENLILTFDLEEFVTPLEVGMNVGKEELFDISLEGFRNLIEILDKHPKIKCTFFTTWEFAEKSKKELKKLMNKGHEIGLHGLTHNINLFNMRYDDVKSELLNAKNNLEKEFNIEVFGFRSPQMRGLDARILKDIGIKYDSSMHPTYIPGRDFNYFKKREAYFNVVFQVPVSVTPFIRMPFSWLWFRNFGLTYSKVCTRLVYLDQDFVNIYFHPWDFVNVNKKPFKGNIMKLIIRRTGGKMLDQFDNYLSWCENNFNSITMKEYFNIKNGS